MENNIKKEQNNNIIRYNNKCMIINQYNLVIFLKYSKIFNNKVKKIV